MDKKKEINNLIEYSLEYSKANITKNNVLKFNIKNVFDLDYISNGLYDLDEIKSEIITNHITYHISKNKPIEELIEHKSRRELVNKLQKYQKIVCEIIIDNEVVLQSYIKGTKTSCALGLFNGLHIRNKTLLFEYLKFNNIDVIEFFKDYFIKIMDINSITQLIFSNQIYDHKTSCNVINYVLDEICETSTSVITNKNGGNNIKTWILNHELDKYYSCNKCRDDHDDCIC